MVQFLLHRLFIDHRYVILDISLPSHHPERWNLVRYIAVRVGVRALLPLVTVVITALSLLLTQKQESLPLLVHKALGLQVEVIVDYRLGSIELESRPWSVRMDHVKTVDVEVVVIKTTDLEHVATVDLYQSWMEFAYGNVR